jgi:hypothetical protein
MKPLPPPVGDPDGPEVLSGDRNPGSPHASQARCCTDKASDHVRKAESVPPRCPELDTFLCHGGKRNVSDAASCALGASISQFASGDGAGGGHWCGAAAYLCGSRREVQPGLVFADSDELLHEALDQFGLPREYAAAMRGHGDALNVLRTSNRLWTYAPLPAWRRAPTPTPLIRRSGLIRLNLRGSSSRLNRNSSTLSKLINL